MASSYVYANVRPTSRRRSLCQKSLGRAVLHQLYRTAQQELGHSGRTQWREDANGAVDIWCWWLRLVAADAGVVACGSRCH